ncbi:MAG: tetratricopeptide repeat protein, partial [Deltaproteobacteria bacterium]|nr:tetratricopeptide repeat protein [Deltaproteobacteria bacterium]
MKTRGAWICVVLVGLACSESKTSKTGDETRASKPAIESNAKAKGPTQSAADASVPEGPDLSDFPPLTQQAFDAERVPAAKKLNRAALKEHRAGRFDQAIAGYKEALRADPGHTLARYNLASAAVSAGKVDYGLAVLTQLAELGCAPCLSHLRHARGDQEWSQLWADPRFLEVTAAGTEGGQVGVSLFAANVPYGARKPRPFTIRAEIFIDREPGVAAVPAFEVQLRDSKGLVASGKARGKPRGY